jgi:hypothetical protein
VLLYDTDGTRYDIMAADFVEVYNWVMQGVQGLLLMAIVKFVMYGTNK